MFLAGGMANAGSRNRTFDSLRRTGTGDRETDAAVGDLRLLESSFVFHGKNSFRDSPCLCNGNRTGNPVGLFSLAVKIPANSGECVTGDSGGMLCRFIIVLVWL